MIALVVIALAAGAASCSSGAKPAEEAVSAPVAEVDTGVRVIRPRAGIEILEGVDEKVFVQFARPLDAGERDALRAAGVVFHETFAPVTYLATVPESAARALGEHPLFRGLEPILPADKVPGEFYAGAIPEHARRPGGAIAALARFYDDVPLARALAVADGAGVAVGDRERFLFGHLLEVTGRRQALLSLVDSPLVRALQELPPPSTVDGG